MRILIKIGGAQLEQPGPRAEFARALCAARAAGHELAVVHGGGNQIRSLCRELGLIERYKDGLRVTDERTADVALMVLAGLINRTLVHALQRAGLPAAGLCGADGNLFAAVPHAPGELGFVGRVERCDPRLAEVLLAAGYTPVIATSAPLLEGAQAPGEHFYNINADMAVAPLAVALRAQAVLFLTDVPGVLDGERRRLAVLTPKLCAALQAQGVIGGGMLPKIESALAALAARPGALVKIAPAQGDNAVLVALDESGGTLFCAAVPEGIAV